MSEQRGQPCVRVEIEGHIGWLIVDHPKRDNALTQAMMAGLPDQLAALDADSRVRVIVLRGVGDRAFISGADISEFGARQESAEAEQRAGDTTSRMFAAFDALEKPLIAMIRGYCLGGGLALALYADIRIAAVDASFAIPATRIGVGYNFELVKLLADRVGSTHAAEILLTGNRFHADRALAMGLVNRLVLVEALEAEVRALAATIAGNAPLSVRAAKAALRMLRAEPGARDVAAIDALTDACMHSADFREGQAAFMQRRKPVFTGR